MGSNYEVRLVWNGKSASMPPGKAAFLRPSEIYPAELKESGDLFPVKRDEGRRPLSDNCLFEADNEKLMTYLIDNGCSGRFNLIYIDPPFLSDKTYVSRVPLNNRGEREWIERPVFVDQGGSGLPAYLDALYQRLLLMKDLLSSNGSIFIHLDWHSSHYVKVLMDEIWGPQAFVNEIIWCYSGGSGTRRHFHRKHDTILWYAKGPHYTFNPQYRQYSPGTLQRGLTRVKGDKYRLREQGALLQDWWADINKILSPTAAENLKFPTQKPLELMRRIISCASDPGDWVADFYSGSGSMLEACEETGRNWMGCDTSAIAVQTTLKRMIKKKSAPFKYHSASIDHEEKGSTVLEAAEPAVHLYGDNVQVRVGIESFRPSYARPGFSWKQYIDFWEIDINHKKDVFCSDLQIMRASAGTYDDSIPLTVSYETARKQSFDMAIRVHDIFGYQYSTAFPIQT